MAKYTKTDAELVLAALSSIVANHGDSFKFSISKAGRIWLTLTHWDNAQYNTSVELDGLHTPEDVPSNIALLLLSHTAKCFHGADKRDTWKDIAEAARLAATAMDALRTIGVEGLAAGGLRLIGSDHGHESEEQIAVPRGSLPPSSPPEQ